MSLDSAIRKLDNGDWEGGLAALNRAWVESRCPKLAAQIERLSAHALAAQPELSGEGKALQSAWENLCAEGKLVGVERLLSVIRDGTAANSRLPDVASLSFRQRSTWSACDVEAVAKRTKKIRNVTLPKAKKAAKAKTKGRG